MDIVVGSARYIFLFYLSIFAFEANAEWVYASPKVGAWDYSEVRCGATVSGYPNEASAASEGAKRNYGNACDGTSASPSSAWGTDENMVPGTCGSTNYYPQSRFGVENINARHYLVKYKPWWDCDSPPSSDGLVVYKKREVECPPGYQDYYTICRRWSDHVDPGKNNEGCLAGENGSNPVHTALGNKLQREQDFDYGNGLGFSRYYSSYWAWGSTPMGTNWGHTFLRSISFHDGTSYGSPATAWVERHDGSRYTFNRSEDGEWVADPDVKLALSAQISPQGDIAGWLLRDENGYLEEYDATGLLKRIDAKGTWSVTLRYASNRLLETVEDNHGRSLMFAYDKGMLVSVTGPDGVLYSYDRDTSGNVIKFIVASSDGEVSRRYHYEDDRFANALTGITDESGQRYATWAYDQSLRAILSVHGDAEGAVDRVSLAYQPDGTTTVIDALGKSRSFRFLMSHGVYRVAGVSEPCASCAGTSSSKSYDANGFLSRTVDFNGIAVDYENDRSGLVLTKTERDIRGDRVRLTQTNWHPDFRVPTERRVYDAANALVSKSSWTYNARGQALTQTQTDPDTGQSRTSKTSYCEQADVTAGACPRVGLVTSVQGPRTDIADITRYTYYPSDAADCATSPTTCSHRKGDLWKVTNALGQVSETLAYDGAGRVLSVKDANGVVTDMSYHPRGWLTSRTLRGASAAEDRVMKIEYAPTGLVSKTFQPDGSFVSFTYDAAHRLTGIADSTGNRIQYTLDNAGNRIKEDTKDANGSLVRTLSRVYNQLGQLATQADAQANPTDFGYDANGNTKTVTDALGRVTQNDYDPLNRLTRTLQDVKGLQVETKFQYDALDNLVQVTDPKGLNTRYSYNALGDLLKLESPDTGITTYAYSSGGNRISQTDARGVTTTYGYDALNRLTQVSYGGASPAIGYSYDQTNPACAAGETFNQGRLTGMSDGSGSTAYCYDRYGQLARKVQTTAGRSHTLRYAYTKAGQLSRITYPDSSVIDYGRNGQGQIAEVGITPTGQARQVLLNQTRHHAFGPIASWTYGNGRRMDRTLDQNYQPKAIEDANNGGLSLGFGFDAVGQLVQLRTADNVDPPIAKFDYDTLGRLTAFKDGYTDVAIETYGYDKTGNRTQMKNASGTTAYSYPANSHRLDKVGAEARNYDAMGNTVAIGGERSFDYDAWGRMTQVKRNNAVAMTYAYNGRGEQVRRYQGATDTAFVYDESGRLLGEYGSDGKAVKQYLWMDDLPVGLLTEGKLHYVQPDHLGTPRVVIDPQRDTAIWKWDLRGEAFGNTVPDEDADGDGKRFTFDLRFPGQRYDAASGLNYNYFRDYEAGTGRYVQSDPIGLGGGISTYGYVGGRPFSAFDPLGLTTTVDDYCVKYGAAACAEVVVPGGSKIAPPALGGGFVAATWCWFTGCLVPNSQESRGNSDPIVLTPVNPGRDCNGNCKPCPPGARWFVNKPGHGHENGYWHVINYNQNPQTCMCHPDRPSGGLDGI